MASTKSAPSLEWDIARGIAFPVGFDFVVEFNNFDYEFTDIPWYEFRSTKLNPYISPIVFHTNGPRLDLYEAAACAEKMAKNFYFSRPASWELDKWRAFREAAKEFVEAVMKAENKK